MRDFNFLVREPLLDPKQRVIGYELTWQQRSDGGKSSDDELIALANFVAEQLINDESGWLLGEKIIFLEASPTLLSAKVLQILPPQNTVLTLRETDFSDTSTLEILRALRKQGYGISLRDADMQVGSKKLSSDISCIEVVFSATDFMAQAKIYAALKHSSIRMVGRPVTTWQDFDACSQLGLDAFVGKLHLTPRTGMQSKGLNSAQTVILQLMELVRKNSDLQQIEAILKRDATLSYKLLRYINSAGFGLGREIQSLRQALALLGYAPLYRWLSLLLATASTAGYSSVLMETAIIRGRFTELLAQSFLPKDEAENIFVAGMFSLLDRLLGLPMEEVLEKVQLPEAVCQALLHRGGIYGPYLALAEACELNSMLVATLASSLKILPEDVNKAHLSALAWSHSLMV